MLIYMLVDLKPTLKIIEVYLAEEVAMAEKRKLIAQDREIDHESSHEYEVWVWEPVA